jgi:hypothetical protein
MDIEGSGMRGGVCRSSERNKWRFASLSRYNMLGFLSMLSSFQPNLRVSHEDLGLNFIFKATDKKNS